MKKEQCPKCNFRLTMPDECCPKCGVVFSKYIAPVVFKQKYTYKMVQAAENLILKAEAAKGNEAAVYLETIVNEMAQKGWEFYRIDEMLFTMTVDVFLGLRVADTPYRIYVITFRRELNQSENAE